MSVLSTANLFPPELVSNVIDAVRGKSSLAALSNSEPIPFSGKTEFIFTMDQEVDIVAENGAKSHGGVTYTPVTVVPIKMEYGARVSDEFMRANEERRLQLMESFIDGFGRKAASGMDLAAFHGINPRTGAASSVVGTNNFDSKVTATVTYNSSTPDANLESAIALVEGADNEVSGIAISPAVRTALAAMTKSTGEKLYPEFAFGGQPNNLGNNALSINKTVSHGNVDHAVVGDFANRFRWGYSSEVEFKVIEYGDPDNTGVDLAGHNQVYLRAELFLGWVIVDPDAFVRIVP